MAARTDEVRAITSVTIAGAEPDVLAARWRGVLGMSAGGCELHLDGAVLRFVAADGRDEGVVAVGLAAPDPRRILAAARGRGLRTDEDALVIGGVRFEPSS
jgi:hypothetical protein